MTPRLTVVVPVYNVEQYLEECLLDQSFRALRPGCRQGWESWM